MKKSITFIFGAFLAFQATAQNDLWCKQHVVQAELPYSAEREQRMKDFDNEQKAIQQAMKQQPPTRQVYKIPVVFHVLHYNGTDNISNEQIYDALEVLNRDFRKLNADTANVQFEFKSSNPNAVATPADIEIEFVLATKAPDGTCFGGITRTVSHTTFSTSNGFVQLDAVMNGNDVYRGIWPNRQYMSIIVAQNLGTAAGYTFKPASFNGDNMYGSIWMNPTYIGRIGTGSEVRSRTLTHEVGHWLNLDHVWGGTNNPGLASNCDEDDDVADTPNTIGVTTCKLNENSCGPKANVENYMDYSYCSKMFTHGQKDRMRAALLTYQRKSLITPQNHVATGIDGNTGLCAVEFRTEKENYCVGETVKFQDYSTQGATSWTWEFEGGTPATSNNQSPSVTYANSGNYNVKLTVSDGTTTLSKTKTAYVRINAVSELPYFESFEDYTLVQEIDNAIIRNFTPNGATFEIVNGSAATGSKSLGYLNYYTSEVATNEFVSPMFDLSSLQTSDKVTLTFKYAYRKKTADNNETVTIYASKDCGMTWNTRKQLIGSSFSNEVLPTSYVPTSEDFKTVHTTGITGTYFTNNFQFKIAFESNGGNNLYLDDINFYKGSPSDENVVGINNLSENQLSWRVYPNPASEVVSVVFYMKTAENMPLNLFDISGKKVFENVYHANKGENEILLDINTLSKGVYMVRLGTEMKKLVIE
ncbi:MAG TPA: M43 family zinc metalloprotease [Crocinitomicaceae bacterium]|nr:M43 family zinc metalloprotease [Crocinitomicaceae bacterium]